MSDTKPIPFVVKLPLVLFSIIALGFLAKLGESVLAPLFLALLIAVLSLPFSTFLEKKLRFNRGLSTITSVLFLIILMLGISYFFINQLSDLSNDWDSLKQHVSVSINELQTWISKTFHINPTKQLKYLNDSTEKAIATSASIVGITLAMFSSGLAFFFFTILFFIFILTYRRLLYNFIIDVFADKHYEKVNHIVMQIQTMIRQYVSGLFIQMAIVSILVTVTLYTMCIKYALLLGVLTGILNVIPYIGIFSAMLISCLIAFASGGAYDSLLVVIAYIIIHAIDGNIILPLVVSSKVKINALFSFLAIVIGEMLWGISGMFLCIPFLAILKIIFDNIPSLKPWGTLIGEEVNPHKKKKRYRLSKRIVFVEKD